MTLAKQKSKQTKLVWNGKEFNLTTEDMSIVSKNFSVDKNGNMSCNNATMNNIKIENGQIRLNGDDNSQIIVISNSEGASLQLEDTYITMNDSNGYGFSLYSNLNGEPYMQLDSRNGITQIKSTEIRSPKVTQSSLAKEKKNFEKYTESALDKIKNIDIYKYNLKSEKDTDKKHIGFVIGKDYKYSKEVTSTDNQGVDNYSFTSLCCKAIQELAEENRELKARIEALEKGEK